MTRSRHTTSRRRCPRHDQPTDTTLCGVCVDELERDLAETPATLEQLDVTISRQTAIGYHEGGRNADTPMPFNVTASTVATALHRALARWTRTYGGPAGDPTRQARWLHGRLRIYIAGHHQAAAFHDETHRLLAEARRVIDRPQDRSRVYVGPCLDDTCPGELWARFPFEDYDQFDRATHAEIACTECTASYPTVEWLRLGARLLKRRAS